MKNKIVTILLITAMLCSTLAYISLPTIVTANPGTIDVPGDYLTITAAIAAASSGDTILVHDGTYNEALYINNKSLTIKAASAPIIKGSQSFTTSYKGSVYTRKAVIFVVNSTNVVIEGFDIEGQGLDGSNAAVVYVYSGGEIKDCTVSPNTAGNMGAVGVEARGCRDLDIRGCTIKEFGRIGIYFANCTGGAYHNTIIGQVYSGQGQVNYGIEVEPHQGACTAEIFENEIYNSDNTYLPYPSWSSAAIIVDVNRQFYDVSPSTVSIENNDIHDNFEAIEIVSSLSSHAHYNDIYDNTYGVWVDSDLYNNYATFDARFNWWGDSSGPYQETTNPSGLGNDCGDYVDYSPWLGFVAGTTPMTWHVNPTGAPNAIQEAINEASSGDTILAHDGTYNEQVTITKNGLHILSASTPVLNGTGLGTSGFLVTADNVEIGGFIIQSFKSTVSGVAGIEMRGANHCWIHDNEIQNNNHGILFGDSTMTTYPSNNYNLIEHNEIHDNNNPAAAWYFTGIGINYWYGTSSHNTIYMNNIYNHNRNGILVGQHERYNPDAVGFGGHTDWQIVENTVTNSGWYGIEVTNGLDCQILHNIVSDAGIGIIVQAWDNGVNSILVDSNEVYDSGTGIYLVTQNTTFYTTLSHVNVTSNIVYSCASYGINSWSTTATQITNCQIGHNTVHDTNSIGMYLINLQDSTIEYNHVYKTNHVGIYVSAGGNVIAAYNEVNNCTYSGIQFLNTIGAKAEHNTVYYNGYSGIYIHNQCPNAIVKYNSVHDNCIGLAANTAGIKVISDGATIEYNTIENNKLDGIYVTSDNNIILRNKIVGNVGAYSGIHLTDTADGNEIHNNCIFSNTGTNVYGIYKEGGSTVNATFNWWGDSTGPYHPTKNPLGLGNQVSNYVLFEPWLKAYFDYYRKNPVAGEPVTFNASLSIQCIKTIVTYTWNFDDGTGNFAESDPIIVHSFSAPGTYNVTLTLAYDDSTTSTEWALVYVASTPILEVEPALMNVGILNKTFQVNVTIHDLDVNQRVVGIQFRLLYDQTLLQVLNVTEGPFMKDPRWNPYGTLFICYVEFDPMYGQNVLVGILLLPSSTGIWEIFPYGSGTLATITFQAIKQERGLEKTPLTCDLTLTDTIVMNDELTKVPHNAESGLFRMHPTNIGDVNFDGKVDMKDIGFVARCFGTVPGDLRWNEAYDVNWDGRIDMRDIGIVARNFGWIPTYDP